jgi:hypothetical protein
VKPRSRTVTGFHRLGVVLAVPVLLGALGVAISAWFSKDGPIIADTAIKETPLPVTLAKPDNTPPFPPGFVLDKPASLAGLRKQYPKYSHLMDIQLADKLHSTFYSDLPKADFYKKVGLPTPFTTVAVSAGPTRTFAFYWADPTKPGQTSGDDTVRDVLGSLFAFETQRGSVVSAGEQPILVGEVLLKEIEDRKSDYLDWTHLKHGFDWTRVAWASAIAAFALLMYLVARALGWVIDGFVSK